jgi:hypothetical protein
MFNLGSIAARGFILNRGNFVRLEISRKHDLEQFDVCAMSELAMTDFRRLMHTRSRLEPHLALALVFKFDPAFEHIYKLKARLVEMWLARELAPGCSNDVGDDATFGCFLHSEVAVLEKGSKAALKSCISRVGDNKTSGSHGSSLGELKPCDDSAD